MVVITVCLNMNYACVFVSYDTLVRGSVDDLIVSFIVFIPLFIFVHHSYTRCFIVVATREKRG